MKKTVTLLVAMVLTGMLVVPVTIKARLSEPLRRPCQTAPLRHVADDLPCKNPSLPIDQRLDNIPYKNPSLPIEQRLDDLISRMTLAEKVGQLRCTMAWNYYERKGDQLTLTDAFRRDVEDAHVGMLWGTFRADPWTRKALDNGLNPALAVRVANMMQRYVMEHTRLGIPLFLAEEAPHGHMAIGATVFPTGQAMAATFSTSLMERVGQVIGKEVRLQGGHISYGPVMDLTRDPRWSRVEESLGEDPVLSGDMAAALVRGLGGGDLTKPFSTLVTLKHFVGYGTPEGGHNARPMAVGRREMLEQLLPPFKKAIEAGARSVMTSYNSLDGMPVTCDSYLLREVLRGEWRFRGFVVSDLYAIDGLWSDHHVVANRDEAGVAALKAGVDADLGAQAYAHLADAVEKGLLTEADIDEAVRNILRMKFEMGLFEHPYVDESAVGQVRSKEHKDVALEVARACVTLLKNDNGVLPLDRKQRIAVIGPNAHNVYNMLGDYTAPQEEGNVKTILDGIREKAAHVEYVKGCAIRDTSHIDIEEAVAAARRVDAIIVAVGGSSARDFKTSYQETGAADVGDATLSDMECGEGYDRATLDLLGRQTQLLRALRQTGKPLVVVYIEGRPLDKRWAAEEADALLTAYYPGQEGGRAIADVIFGDYNPAGRLPVSVPAHVGQIPVYYNQKNPDRRDYMDMAGGPLYAFGYGLSYTTFKYDNLAIDKKEDGKVVVAFDITNTGKRDGEEVPQLYLRDEVASTVQPQKQLKRFDRVMVPAGETRHVDFVLAPEDFSIIDRDMRRVVEPGDFKVMVGAASNDIRLEGVLAYPN